MQHQVHWKCYFPLKIFSYDDFTSPAYTLLCVYWYAPFTIYGASTYHFTRFSWESFESLVILTCFSLYYCTASYNYERWQNINQAAENTVCAPVVYTDALKPVCQEHWVLTLALPITSRVSPHLCASVCASDTLGSSATSVVSKPGWASKLSRRFNKCYYLNTPPRTSQGMRARTRYFKSCQVILVSSQVWKSLNQIRPPIPNRP